MVKDNSNGTGFYEVFPDTSGVGRPDGWLWWPDNWDRTRTKKPLLVMLAGRADTPQHVKSSTFPVMNTIQTDMGAFVLGLTGKTSSSGGDSWNASQECCWPPLDGAGPDDETYIDNQIQAVIDQGWPVDTKQIYVWGHSAGSAMAFRYACDHPSRVAAVFGMSTFGIRTDVDAACAAGHVSIAHFHGTADSVAYNNSTHGALAPNTVEYVSVEAATAPTATATQIANQNGCTGSLSIYDSIDFDGSQAGNETDRKAFATCPTGGAGEVWTANGTGHTPTMTTTGYQAMYNWLLAHPKP